MTPPGFEARIAEALRDKPLRKAVGNATARFTEAREEAFANEPGLEAMRDAGKEIKDRALAKLPRLTATLERQITAQGGHLYRATDADAAVRYILDLARKNFVRIAVKSKSMTTEEIGLTEALEGEEIEAIETDLGERIIQLANEKPAHIILPAIHKTREQVSKLFAEKLNVPQYETIPELTNVARTTLREKFLAANMGITGGNFLVAETGTLVIVENEGNVRLTTALPRIHVAVVGIEKLIENLADLPTLLRLLTTSATGQRITSYVSMISGPRRAGEPDGAEEFHLVLLDNGRSQMLADPVLKEVLRCIRCGACLNGCPVYRRIGGHAYGSVYPGPIGSVITPALGDNSDGSDLSTASSLCGVCREVCPVKIDLPKLLIHQRTAYATDRAGSAWEKLGFRVWALAMSSPKRAALARTLFKKLVALTRGRLPYPLSGWTRTRELPYIPEETFRQWWETRHGRR